MVEYNAIGPGERAQLKQCLPHQLEDMSSNLAPEPTFKSDVVVCTREVETDGSLRLIGQTAQLN